MATENLTKAGDFNLEQIELISYRNNVEEGLPLSMDIKPITIQLEYNREFSFWRNHRV
mgnify:CR=1 FL=1